MSVKADDSSSEVIPSIPSLISIFRKDDVDFIHKYEKTLIWSLAITSPFQDILEGKVNERKRFLQLLLILVDVFYVIPKYTFFCLLYLTDESTRRTCQYYFADYFEEFGTFGRVLNILYPVFTVTHVLDKIVLRKNQTINRLNFLTDLLKLKTPNNWDGLDETERTDLLKNIKRKVNFTRAIKRPTILSVNIYDLVGCPLFIARKRPGILVSFFAIGHSVCLIILADVVISHYFSLYLSYIITTDCLTARIHSLSRRIRDLKYQINEDGLRNILIDIDLLKETFQIYSKIMRPLLRNLVYIFKAGVGLLFFLATIDTGPFMMVMMITTVFGMSACVMVTGIYVSNLESRLRRLCHELNCLASCIAHCGRDKVTLKTQKNMRLVIKELSTHDPSGNFIIGLTDGSGPAISKKEMTDLTLETICNTLMFMEIFR